MFVFNHFNAHFDQEIENNNPKIEDKSKSSDEANTFRIKKYEFQNFRMTAYKRLRTALGFKKWPLSIEESS